MNYIYTLSDNSGVRYVGKSENPNYRLRKHLNEAHLKRTKKEKWIYSLLQKGEKPILEIIEEFEDNWEFWEKYWICQFKAWNFSILNGTDGGERSNGFKGKTHSKETIEKCREGAKKSKRIYGELNFSSKLTTKQVKEIRENKEGLSKAQLYRKYNIAKTTLYKIIDYKVWKNID